jgi:Na+(H+)/acetate symporter ActP
MQARLEINRFPSILVAIVFAVAAALVLGGALGYVLKPASTISGPARVIVLSDSQVGNAHANDCVWSGKQKDC